MLAALTSNTAMLADSAMESEQEFILKVIAVGGGLILATVWVFLRNIREVSVKRDAEKTKREIAAYVAEGSISPQDAATIINANSDSEAEIASAVAAGTISPAKAEKLIASLRAEFKPAPNS